MAAFIDVRGVLNSCASASRTVARSSPLCRAASARAVASCPRALSSPMAARFAIDWSTVSLKVVRRVWPGSVMGAPPSWMAVMSMPDGSRKDTACRATSRSFPRCQTLPSAQPTRPHRYDDRRSRPSCSSNTSAICRAIVEVDRSSIRRQEQRTAERVKLLQVTLPRGRIDLALPRSSRADWPRIAVARNAKKATQF